MLRPTLPLTLASIWLLALAACQPEANRFSIELVLDIEGCGGGSCENLAMACDAEVLVRIVPTDDSTAQPFLITCQRITGGSDFCEVGKLNLSSLPDIPNQRVEIQVGVWRYDGTLDCGPLSFAPTGSIDRNRQPYPVVGGRTFFEVGSSELATVHLECLNAPELNAKECGPPESVDVAIGVNNIDLAVAVDPKIAAELKVSVGAPSPIPGGWRLVAPVELEDTSSSPPNLWTVPADKTVAFDGVACAQVERASLPKRAATVTCTPVEPDITELSMIGWYVDTQTLQQIRTALGLLSPPAAGMVVGLVLRPDGIQPMAGVVVTASPPGATVHYLSEDMSTTVGVTSTQSSGLFVSLDADFLTSWSGRQVLPGLQVTEQPGFGGLLSGNVTVVVLRMAGE